VSGIWIAVVAHLLIGGSLVWDKVLLGRPKLQSVVNYVFWLGAMSVFGVLLAVLGFHWPSGSVMLLGFVAGLVHLAANFFYYAALKRGEASETLALMGGLSPTATALIAIALLKQPLGGSNAAGFVLMVAGGFVMCFAQRLDWRRILPPAIAAAAIFGLTNVLQKLVFNETDFVPGYIFFTLGTFAGALLLLVRPCWREQIFHASEEAPPRSKFWYFVNRFVSGVGSFLVFLAISRANPAVVDAISGLRYAVIFAGTLALTKWRPAWLREEFTGRSLVAKCVATSLVIAGLVLVG
jgi:drug/metabolite transporter (DMT)-like permease